MTARAPGALSSAAAAAAILVAGVLGEPVLFVAVLLLQAFSAWSWRQGVTTQGIGQASLLAWIMGACAAAAIAWDIGTKHEPLLPVVLMIGVGFLGLIVVQLARRHPRRNVTSGMAAASLLLVVLVLGAIWLDVFTVVGGRRAIVVGVLPVVVAAFARLLPLPWSVPGALLLGTLAGAVLGVAVPLKGDPIGVVAGAAVGALGGLVVALHALLSDRADVERRAQAPVRAEAGEAARARGWLLATAPFPVFVAAALVYPVLRLAVG